MSDGTQETPPPLSAASHKPIRLRAHRVIAHKSPNSSESCGRQERMHLLHATCYMRGGDGAAWRRCCVDAVTVDAARMLTSHATACSFDTHWIMPLTLFMP